MGLRRRWCFAIVPLKVLHKRVRLLRLCILMGYQIDRAALNLPVGGGQSHDARVWTCKVTMSIGSHFRSTCPTSMLRLVYCTTQDRLIIFQVPLWL